MPKRKPHRIKRILPLALFVAAVAGAAFVWHNLPGWLEAPDPVGRVDVVVVPAGDADVRLPRALELLEHHRTKTVWVLAAQSGPVLTERQAIEAFAKKAGHGKEVEILKQPSSSLISDARAVADRLGRRSLRVAVLTDPIKVARTRLVFARETGASVSTWQAGQPSQYSWVAIAAESVKLLGTVAVEGPGPELAPGRVPLDLPLRAVAGGFVVALLVGALCRPLARRLRLVAAPRLWRAHTTPTPMLGGLALLVGLAGGVAAAGGVRLGALGAAAAGGVAVVALVGFIDDVAGLGARVRLMWAGAAGAVAWLLGLRAEVLTGGAMGAEIVNAVVTILWFMGVTHALNILDNIDGAVGGVAAIGAATIAVAAALGGQFVVAVAAASLAGACLGYLVHNAPPARLFMGDMGALGMGFALAALALALTPSARPPLSMATPVMALGVPIFDTILVSWWRIVAGRSPAHGGTDHTSHRLLAHGWSVRRTVVFLWAAQAGLGVVAVLIARTSPVVGWALVGVVGAGGIASLVVFLRMAPWDPPWQLRASQEVVTAVEKAMSALRQLEEAVGDEAWRLSNPKAARSTHETLKRLEKVRSLLEEGRSAGA